MNFNVNLTLKWNIILCSTLEQVPFRAEKKNDVLVPMISPKVNEQEGVTIGCDFTYETFML